MSVPRNEKRPPGETEAVADRTGDNPAPSRRRSSPGTPEFSVAGRTNGDPRVAFGLTATGRTQARRLGELLARQPLDLCVVSEFQRARETADLALAGRDVPRLVVSELNDIRFGEFEGLALADYRAWARAHAPEEPAPGGGESRAGRVRRYVRGYRIRLSRPKRTMLVVVHGLPVRYVLDALAARGPPPPPSSRCRTRSRFRVDAPQLEQAVARLEAWTASPAWSRRPLRSRMFVAAPGTFIGGEKGNVHRTVTLGLPAAMVRSLGRRCAGRQEGCRACAESRSRRR
ncbi:MAG TPA: histidine phosphatase family protein, partial [Gaiellales bacterium]|nr:histidine phosphatase family protein [Gaiellales bacterium]